MPPSSSSSSNPGCKQKRKLSDTETLVFTYLFAQANDASSRNPILGDPYAQQYINKFDHETYKLGAIHDNAEKGNLQVIMRRQRQHDRWVQSFIDRHAATNTPVTVVYLGCALDSRNMRVRRGPSVRWVDVDSVEGISLRKRHMPTPGGDYHMVAADDLVTTRTMDSPSTTTTTKHQLHHHHQHNYHHGSSSSSSSDPVSWLRAIPADRPTYIVAEMWLSFFKPQDSRRLIHRLVEYFGSSGKEGGQLGIDMMGTGTVMRDHLPSFLLPSYSSSPTSSFSSSSSSSSSITRRGGGGGGGGIMPRVRWGVNDPEDISKLHPNRLRLRQYLTWWDLVGGSGGSGSDNNHNSSSITRGNDDYDDGYDYGDDYQGDDHRYDKQNSRHPRRRHRDRRPMTPPSLFGRWTPIVSRIPGFKRMVKTALYDFGPLAGGGVCHRGTAHGGGGGGGGGDYHNGPSSSSSPPRRPPMTSSGEVGGGGEVSFKGMMILEGQQQRISTTTARNDSKNYNTWLADEDEHSNNDDDENNGIGGGDLSDSERGEVVPHPPLPLPQHRRGNFKRAATATAAVISTSHRSKYW